MGPKAGNSLTAGETAFHQPKKTQIMYKFSKPAKTTMHVNESYEGETIEEKIRRVVNNKEPITDGAPLIYTERKDGVQPQYNIRTDRFDVAVEAMDKVAAATIAKRSGNMHVVKDEPAPTQAPEPEPKKVGEA